jgi:hypothetical protein
VFAKKKETKPAPAKKPTSTKNVLLDDGDSDDDFFKKKLPKVPISEKTEATKV